jgi:uncharacterized membrane protein YfhO
MDGWIPYRATVRSPADGWLETPRAFQSGYVATVNGQPAEVKESPEALVSVAVPRGDSAVQLEYRPPAGLRPLFWLSFLSAVAVLLVGAAKFILNLLGKPYPAKTSNAA